MLRRYLSTKINLIDGSVIILSLFWFLLNRTSNQPVTSELIINLTFLMLFVTLVVFRNENIRHMYFGFILLSLTAISHVFGYDQFVYMVSSLTLSLFILGVINMLLFKNDS